MEIDSLRILNPGIGYTQAPEVSFTGFSTVGVGTFIYNEEVTGQTSGVTAVVRDFRRDTTVRTIDPPVNLRVSLNTGNLVPGETIVGAISSLHTVVKEHDLESYDNPYDTNEEIELESR